MNRQFLTEFIEMYRSLPCVWKIKSADYSDRIKKNNAYEQLLAKLKEVDCDASITTVKKKIDSLRSIFRRELKKMRESQKSGAGSEETYKPHLWYFENLLFLIDQETPRQGIDNLSKYDNCNSNQEDESNWTPEETILSPSNSVESIDVLETPQSSSTISSAPSRPTSQSLRAITKRKRCRADDVLDKVAKKLDEPQSSEDQFDIVGKNIANKLRSLPKEVGVVAEKLVMDILYEACLGNVDKYSQINIYNSRNHTGHPEFNNMQYSQYTHMLQIPPVTGHQFCHSHVSQQIPEIPHRLYPTPGTQFGQSQEPNASQQFGQSHSLDIENNASQSENVRLFVSTFTSDK